MLEMLCARITRCFHFQVQTVLVDGITQEVSENIRLVTSMYI